MKNFDKAAIKILFEHSDQFRRFAPDVRAQLLWLVDNADRMNVVEGVSGGNAFRLILSGEPNKPIVSFELIIELHRPEDKDSRRSLFLHTQKQALISHLSYYQPMLSMLLPHGDRRRSPAIDSRTGKPYVAVPAKLLDALSGEDRDYVAFFAYSLNDAIHAAFGTPLPPTNKKDWIAGKYLTKGFLYPRCLWFLKKTLPNGNEQILIRNSSTRIPDYTLALDRLEKEFPVQKKVFDDITDFKDFRATRTPDYFSAESVVPLWGPEFLGPTLSPTESYGTQEPYEIALVRCLPRLPEPTLIEPVCHRVYAALSLLENLKSMREHLIQRDYSTPETAGTPKGKAMLALFENLRKTEIGLAKVLLKNTKLKAEPDAQALPDPQRYLNRWGFRINQTELGALYFPEDVIEDNGGSIIFCESLFPGYSDEPWTLLDPEGRTRKAYEKRLAEYEKKFPPVLKGEPMILEGLRRRERAAAATNAEK